MIILHSKFTNVVIISLYICVVVAATRMSNFVAGLINENPEITAPVYKQYNYVQYNGILPAAATGSVSFPPSDDTFRYVIIQQQFSGYYEAICMFEVKVFLRGTLLLVATSLEKIQCIYPRTTCNVGFCCLTKI